MQYKYNFQVGEIFMTPNISKHTLQRLPMYLSYIQGLPEDAPKNISATTIAEALQLNDVQVRKDLASVSSSGKPKVGYNVKDLIAELEAFLGYNDIDNAVIVGAGSLGKALLNYSGFKAYGLNIIAAFDLCEEPTEFQGKTVFPIAQLGSFCRKVNVHIGIITVPASSAQEICDLLVESGIPRYLELCSGSSRRPGRHTCPKREYGVVARSAFKPPARADEKVNINNQSAVE